MILDEMSRRQVTGRTLSMGMDSRYTRFVLDQLSQQTAQGLDGGVFELGFGSGIFLQAAAKAGYRVGGLEVTRQLFEEARSKLPESNHRNLWFGDFCSIDFADQTESYSLAYWNDVFEHIPVDEISDYLHRLHALLQPGGKLITITPNWHMRPSDVTALFKPHRSEAVGFHLKEYTLREVRQLLLNAGFNNVQTPLFISSKRFYFSSPLDMTFIKSLMEPLLEYLPVWAAIQGCRRFGLNCTIATKCK
jgi:SAM-dependent methyltransferase